MFDHLTADPHYDHPNIIKHCARPFEDVDAMNDYMVERWNAHVGKKEHVGVIGDFAFKRHGRWLNALNGRITLVAGNHDKMPVKILENFTQAIGKDRYPGILEYRVDNQPVVLCHYPLYTWRWASHGAWMLHGHSHGRVQHPEHILALDVGVDLWGFTPVPWDVIVARMQSKIAAREEHQRTVRRPRVDYWQDVVRDQYIENIDVWAQQRHARSKIPWDPRDDRKQRKKKAN